MLIRFLLVFSLIGQLALSYRCCGIAMLRPDVFSANVSAAALSECASQCAMDAAACEGEQITSCCGEDCEQPIPEPADAPCDGTTPCGDVCIVCLPLDNKKQSVDGAWLPPIAVVAHPAILPSAHSPCLKPQFKRVPSPLTKSNHARQAWLVVWVI